MNCAASTNQELVGSLLQRLWPRPRGCQLSNLLPQTWGSLRTFYEELRGFCGQPGSGIYGEVSDQAMVDGTLLYVGKGAVIEAGAVIHKSARLHLAAGSRIRAGAVIRDEVVIGPDCSIGVNCEVTRCLITGPESNIAHLAFVGDSVLGARINVAGGTMVANTPSLPSGTICLRLGGKKIDSKRSHLGMLAGDGVRLGANTTVCPGTIISPELTLPPAVTLLGLIDADRRKQLLAGFFQLWEPQ